MSSTAPEVTVIFRVWNTGEHDVFALFPDLPGDVAGRHCMCYQHVGQHGAADYIHCIMKSRPAAPEEYADLARELNRVGYRLRVRKRRSYPRR